MDRNRHALRPDRRHVARALTRLALSSFVALAQPAFGAELLLGVSLQGPLALPFHVADTQGYFTAEGVPVRTVGCNGGSRCFTDLLAGSVQMATAGELRVVFSSFERRDYAIVATVATSTNNIKIVGRKSAGVTEALHLAGKRVGVLHGSSSHYALDAMLLFHGVDPASVQFVRLTIETIVAALVGGDVDAIAAYNPQAMPAMKQLGADALLLPNPRIYTETFNLVADRATLAERPDDIVRMLRALRRAERFIAEKPQQAKKILLSKSPPFDMAYIDAVFADCSFRLGLEQSLVGTMEGQARWAIREKHVPFYPKTPNFLDYIEAGPLRQAVPSAFVP